MLGIWGPGCKGHSQCFFVCQCCETPSSEWPCCPLVQHRAFPKRFGTNTVTPSQGNKANTFLISNLNLLSTVKSLILPLHSLVSLHLYCSLLLGNGRSQLGQSLLFSRLKNPNSPSPPLQETCSTEHHLGFGTTCPPALREPEPACSFPMSEILNFSRTQQRKAGGTESPLSWGENSELPNSAPLMPSLSPFSSLPQPWQPRPKHE